MAQATGDAADTVATFYRDYTEAYNRGDYDHYVACFDVPLSVTSAGGVRTIDSRDALHRMAMALREQFTRQDWGRTDIARHKVWLLGDDLALVVADLARRRRDGSIFQAPRYLYTVRRVDCRWRIAAVAECLEPRVEGDPLLGL